MEQTTLFNYTFRKNKKPLLLFVGESGCGKDYMVKLLGLSPVVSYTTRPIRPSETNGVEHFFVDKKFYCGFPKERIAAFTSFHNNYYWASIDELENKDVYIIDPAGVNTLLTNPIINPDKLYIVRFDVSELQLIYNLLKRGETDDFIISRMINDKQMFDNTIYKIKYDVKWTPTFSDAFDERFIGRASSIMADIHKYSVGGLFVNE